MKSRFLVTVALTAMLSGCETPPEGTWVTRLPNTDAWLAISVADDAAAAFVCGGATTIDTHTRWMLSSVTSSKVTFKQDDWVLDVNLTDGDAGGQLREPSGAAIAFEARRVGEQDLEGVYFGFDEGCGDGLIVLDGTDPQKPDALGAWCDSSGLRAQVTPVLPIELTADGIAAFVELDGGRRDFFMRAVPPSAVTP